MKSQLWLDLQNRSIHQGNRTVSLRPKVFAFLQFLMTRPGQTVPIADVQRAVWGTTRVSSGTVKNCVLELRTALGDTSQTPRYLQTLPRRGYCLLVPIPTMPSTSTLPHQQELSPTEKDGPIVVATRVTPYFVGRASEQAELRNLTAQATNGTRQCLFITGELGVGKTALIEALRSSLSPESSVWFVKSHCIEHRGPHLPYLPIIVALEQLLRSPERDLVIELLRQLAPSWLLFLPIESKGYQNQAAKNGTPHERLTQEFALFIEVLAQHRLLVFWLDDLHWADNATIDLLNFVIRRDGSARLFLIGTFRPDEALSQRHQISALMQDLLLHNRAIELRMPLLTERDLFAYLAARFPALALTDLSPLSQWLYQRTEGNPLFLDLFIDGLREHGYFTTRNDHSSLPSLLPRLNGWVPDKLQQLTWQMLRRLSTYEIPLLSAASVMQKEFSAAAVATATDLPVEEVDAACSSLAAQHQFLLRQDSHHTPERRQSSRYMFLHCIYREVIYQSLSLAQRKNWHWQVARWMETAYGPRTNKCADEIAAHFERGHDFVRAKHYRELATGSTQVVQGSGAL